MPFDSDSGLQYSERVIKARELNEGSLLTKCLGRKPQYSSPHHGAESLGSLAKRKFLCNLDHLNAESLQGVPDVLLETLWNEIRRS